MAKSVYILAAIVVRACNRKKEEIECCGSFVCGEKMCLNLHQRRKVKLNMCSDRQEFPKNMRYNVDPFVTVMGNFNWGPISRNDIVSSFSYGVDD